MKFETQVKEIIRRTPDVKSFRFPRPEGFDYRPGQFIVVKLKGLRKHFTISSSPAERDFIEFTKKLTGHEFSNALDSLHEGDRVGLDGPFGSFTFAGEFPRVGMLSGGIGITPLRSMCKYCSDKGLGAKITLIYGNRSEADIAFREEFEEMARRNTNFRLVLTLDQAGPGWKGKSGRIDAAMVREEIPDFKETTFYTCGPPAMVDAMRKLLGGLGLPKERVKFENFTGY